MSCILEGLIERQARGGNSVILLSATLSQQQRDKLVAAFARGIEGQQEAPLLEKDDYPLADARYEIRCAFTPGSDAQRR